MYTSVSLSLSHLPPLLLSLPPSLPPAPSLPLSLYLSLPPSCSLPPSLSLSISPSLPLSLSLYLSLPPSCSLPPSLSLSSLPPSSFLLPASLPPSLLPGKTHTMLGTVECPGVMFHTMMELYRCITKLRDEKTFEVTVSYCEVICMYMYIYV